MDQYTLNTLTLLGVIAATLFIVMFWTMIFPILYHTELNELMIFFLCIISIIIIVMVGMYINNKN